MKSVTEFTSPMYVYSAESGYISGSLKVYIPEVFLTSGKASDRQYSCGNLTNMFINAETPAISNIITTMNYISLPFQGGGNSGYVSVGDRYIAMFINNNPKHGFILGRG